MASISQESVMDAGIHTEIQVMVTEDHLCLFPVSSSRPETPKDAIVFDRATQVMSVEPIAPAIEKYSTGKPVIDSLIAFGVLGIITLHSGIYVMVIKRRILVGLMDGHTIYKIAEPAIFRVSNKGSKDARDDSDSTSAQSSSSKGDGADKKRDENYVRILRTLLKAKDFYFSYTADISNSLMRKSQQPEAFRSKPLWMRWEDRFWCNRVISQILVEKRLNEWVLPILRGIIQIYVVVVQRQPFEFFLISRRSRHRAGTRYKTRGVDVAGNVANYVETEEIVAINGHWMSFVQVRGSIPLIWEQTGRKYTPIPKISPDAAANASGFSKHFSQQLSLYQRQIVVNLLDQRGGVESELSSLYEAFCSSAMANQEDLTLFSFDFHDKCKTSYDNVSELITSLSPELERMGLFHRDASGKVLSNQIGTVRTNCLDCLDRTNLVQSFIGRYFMIKMLRSFNIRWDTESSTLNISSNPSFSNSPSGSNIHTGTSSSSPSFNNSSNQSNQSNTTSSSTNGDFSSHASSYGEFQSGILEKIFKEAWASNGDAISLQYAGTGALKSDFTRTGKRQTKGVMKDGVNSLNRYYINIFKDTLRQAAIDLFYGTMQGQNRQVLEEDVLQQRGLWNKAQYHAIEECTAYLEDGGGALLAEDEVITHAWIIISINEMDIEQERVLVLTNKSLFRFKYNFNSSKIARNKHLHLSDIIGITIGPFANKPNNFGFSLAFANPENKTQNAHIYCPLDSSQYNAFKTMNAIADAVRETCPRLSIDEKTMTRTKTVRGAVLNKFKLGMFNGKSKQNSSSSSSSKGKEGRETQLSSSSSNIPNKSSSGSTSPSSLPLKKTHTSSVTASSASSSALGDGDSDDGLSRALAESASLREAQDDDDDDFDDDDPSSSAAAQGGFNDDDEDDDDNEF